MLLVPHVSVRWSTPRRLRTYALVIWALCALLLFAGEGTLSRARRAMKTIGKDAGPSILAAQEIRSALADLDANAANLLLGTANQRAEAQKVFERRRTQATGRLVDAAQNITYEGERAPIVAMMDELGRYLEVVTEARLRYETRDARGAVETYGAASGRMHDKILAAAQALDQVNRSYMDDVYEAQRRASAGAEGVAVVLGGALVASLTALQVFLFLRMRRILNPSLAAATAFAIFFTLHLAHAFGAARE